MVLVDSKKFIIDSKGVILDAINDKDIVNLKKNNNSFIRANSNDKDMIGFLNQSNNRFYFFDQLLTKSQHIVDITKNDNDKQLDYNFSEIICNFSILDMYGDYKDFNEKGQRKLIYNDLNKLKELKIKSNESKYKDFLKNKTISFNNKDFTFSFEDQQAILLLINKIDLNIIEFGYWHDKYGSNTQWNEKELIELLIKMEKEYSKVTNKKEKIKEEIYNCKTFQQIQNIKIKYE